MPETMTFALLVISLITLSFILILLRKYKKNTQIKRTFIVIINLALWWVLLELLQLILNFLFDIPNSYDIYFESFASIGKCFMPVFVFLLGLVFARTKVKFNKSYLLLFVIPTLTIILMLTNKYHSLVYKNYSIYTYEAILGPYSIIHQIYSYGMLGIGMIFLLYYSIKNSGFFSKQSVLIVIGTVIPVLINLLETYKIVKLSVYSTPISFAFAVAIYALAIFKFDFLKVAPIALQRIVDRISDSYIVVNEDNVIIDFNETFLKTFKVSSNDVRNKNLFDLFKKYESFNMASNKIVKDTNETIVLEEYFDKIDKYFNIEITRIESKGNFLGTLILFKDITQHTIDMQTIRDNQDMLVEKERLASLGQMIGGIAHNLKTPIMSIAGAAEGLSDLIKEYDSSIGDNEVTEEDHHEIAKDMQEWIEKTRTHLSYMSDVITAIKGQAVAFSEQKASGFTIKELINYVDILMKHELKNGLTNLKTQADIDTSTVVQGNINSLVQVINNIISNAIQAYQEKGKSNQDINFTIYKENNNIVFKVQDFAGGLPKKVQDKLFKEMITTKGKNGTGLGLFMSYSNIKAHFSGKLDYETEKGKGTTFYIRIPV
ncbi:MAG: PAS domain-containing protein [Clostridia bacterium]|nr:PAS domain-containing protein [Clostridia bacterium]